MAIVLAEEEHVGQERVCELIQALTGGKVDLSEGCLNNIIKRFSGRLDEELTKMEEDLLNGLVMHTDETLMKATEWIESGKESETATLKNSSKRAKWFICACITTSNRNCSR